MGEALFKNTAVPVVVIFFKNTVEPVSVFGMVLFDD